ncbi:MAG: hypothetical protein Q9213_002974 [Squamulea squamosa]
MVTPTAVPPTEQPHSCVTCQRRKVKCERRYPCSNCVKHGSVCEFRAPAPPRRRKRRASPDPDIHAKLKRAEEILQGYGIDPDDLNKDNVGKTPTETKQDAASAGNKDGLHTLDGRPVASQRSTCRLQR